MAKSLWSWGGARVRVLIVLPNLNGGGAQRMALDLAEGLVSGGDDVALCTAGFPGDFGDEAHEFVLHSMDRRITVRTLPTFLRLVLTAISSDQPDVILSHLLPTNLLLLALARFRMVRVPVAVVEHNHLSAAEDLESYGRVRRLLRRWMIRACFPAAAAVVGVSSRVSDDLQARLPQCVRVQTIPNGVNVEGIRAAASSATLESETIARFPRPVIVAAGRLVAAKGFDDLLAAFARFRSEQQRVGAPSGTLVILGKGPLQTELEQYAERLGIHDAVHFFGFVANPWAAMRSCDLFVLGSRHEGFGLVVAEAVALGLPVVATDCEAGPAEILSGNLRARLVQVGDSDAMARAMAALLGDQSAPTAMRLPEQFTVRTMVQNYRLLLRDVVDR